MWIRTYVLKDRDLEKEANRDLENEKLTKQKSKYSGNPNRLDQIEDRISGLTIKVPKLEHSDSNKEKYEIMNMTWRTSGTW